jgi:glycerol-3-phosphate dehydrogenase (NAD(P)+)
MQRITIVGTTSWGITLSILHAGKGNDVRLWARTEREAVKLRKKGLNPERFPDIALPENVTVTSRLDEAMEEVNAVILPVPSPSMRQNISQVASHLTKSTIIISAAKGLEVGSNKRMSQVIAEEINPRFTANICVLSGPNLAREIVRNLPAAAVVASEDKSTAQKAQRLLTCPGFCVFTNTDIIGVELGAGIADGLGYGDNAKAAFLTRGLTEITALGMALGANPLTFSGLAGLGDVIATCASPLSRNHYVGTELAKGRSLADIVDSMNEVAEGINTTMVAQNLALYENADPRQVAQELMGGNARHELSGRRWQLFSLFRHRRKNSIS